MHDVELEDDAEEFQDAHHSDQHDQLKQPDQSTSVNKPLEVIVTDQQCTMTFNGEQVHICEEVILPNPNEKSSLKLLQSVKTENCVYTFSINTSIFFTITINPAIG